MESKEEKRAPRPEGLSGEDYLLVKADEQDFITYDDILTAFPEAEESLDEIEDILVTLIEADVEIGDLEEKGRRAAKSSGDREQDGDHAPDNGTPLDAIRVDDSIGLYLKEIGQVPLLTREEEIRLAKRMEAGKDARVMLRGDGLSRRERVRLEAVAEDGLSAREHLVRANSRLVVSVAKKYMGRGVPFIDLIQGEYRPDPGGKEVRLQTGQQVFDVCDVVDSSSSHPGDC